MAASAFSSRWVRALRTVRSSALGASKISLQIRTTEFTNPTRFEYARNERAISEEAALDGFYVLRTSVTADGLSAQAVVRAYKLLAQVEQAFRAMKSPELEIRPLHHRLEERVRAHVFLCMLAYTVRFEIEARLAPLLFKDDSPLAPALFAGIFLLVRQCVRQHGTLAAASGSHPGPAIPGQMQRARHDAFSSGH